MVPPGHRFSCYVGGTCCNIAVHLTFLRENFIHLAPQLLLSHSPLSFFSAPNLALCFSKKTEPSLTWLHEATPSLFGFLLVLSRRVQWRWSLIAFLPFLSVLSSPESRSLPVLWKSSLVGVCIRATNLFLSSLCHNIFILAASTEHALNAKELDILPGFVSEICLWRCLWMLLWCAGYAPASYTPT